MNSFALISRFQKSIIKRPAKSKENLYILEHALFKGLLFERADFRALSSLKQCETLALKVTLITLNEGCNFRELSTKHETRTDNFKVVIDN